MIWSVSQNTESVHHVGILTIHGFNRSGPLQCVFGLHPSNVGRDVPMGKNPARVSTFLNQFINVGGNYHATYFQTPGWVSVFKQQWWSSLILYVLEVFVDDLLRMGLYEAIRALCFWISISIPTFYTILECTARRRGHSLHQSANWGWRSTRYGKYRTSQWVCYHTRSTFHVLKS